MPPSSTLEQFRSRSSSSSRSDGPRPERRAFLVWAVRRIIRSQLARRLVKTKSANARSRAADRLMYVPKSLPEDRSVESVVLVLDAAMERMLLGQDGTARTTRTTRQTERRGVSQHVRNHSLPSETVEGRCSSSSSSSSSSPSPSGRGPSHSPNSVNRYSPDSYPQAPLPPSPELDRALAECYEKNWTEGRRRQRQRQRQSQRQRSPQHLSSSVKETEELGPALPSSNHSLTRLSTARLPTPWASTGSPLRHPEGGPMVKMSESRRTKVRALTDPTHTRSSGVKASLSSPARVVRPHAKTVGRHDQAALALTTNNTAQDKASGRTIVAPSIFVTGEDGVMDPLALFGPLVRRGPYDNGKPLFAIQAPGCVVTSVTRSGHLHDTVTDPTASVVRQIVNRKQPLDKLASGNGIDASPPASDAATPAVRLCSLPGGEQETLGAPVKGPAAKQGQRNPVPRCPYPITPPPFSSSRYLSPPSLPLASRITSLPPSLKIGHMPPSPKENTPPMSLLTRKVTDVGGEGGGGRGGGGGGGGGGGVVNTTVSSQKPGPVTQVRHRQNRLSNRTQEALFITAAVPSSASTGDLTLNLSVSIPTPRSKCMLQQSPSSLLPSSTSSSCSASTAIAATERTISTCTAAKTSSGSGRGRWERRGKRGRVGDPDGIKNRPRVGRQVPLRAPIPRIQTSSSQRVCGALPPPPPTSFDSLQRPLGRPQPSRSPRLPLPSLGLPKSPELSALDVDLSPERRRSLPLASEFEFPDLVPRGLSFRSRTSTKRSEKEPKPCFRPTAPSCRASRWQAWCPDCPSTTPQRSPSATTAAPHRFHRSNETVVHGSVRSHSPSRTRRSSVRRPSSPTKAVGRSDDPLDLGLELELDHRLKAENEP